MTRLGAYRRTIALRPKRGAPASTPPRPRARCGDSGQAWSEACPHPRSRTHAPADDLVDAKRAGTTVRNPEALSKRNGLGRSSHWVALTDGLSRSSAAFLELWRLLGTRLLLLSPLFSAPCSCP